MNITPSPSSPQKSMSSPSDQSPSNFHTKLSSEDRYVDQLISKLFHVTLSPQNYGDNLIHLQNFAEKLQTTHLSLDTIDLVLLELFRLPINSRNQSIGPLSTITSIYNRTLSEKQTVESYKPKRKRGPSNEFRLDTLNHILKILIRYAGIVVLNADCFATPDQNESTDSDQISEIYGIERGATMLLNLMLKPPDNPYVANPSFLNAFVDVHQDNLQLIFHSLFTQLASRITKSTLLDNYIPLLNCFEVCTRRKELLSVMVSHEKWIPSTNNNGRTIEQESLLGPLFSLHATARPVAEHHFGRDTLQLTRDQVAISKTILRDQHRKIQSTLKRIMLNLLKPKETRSRALEWIGVAIRGNEARNRIVEDSLTSSSDGFMNNLSCVMLHLCEPFLDLKKKKIDSIAADYPMRTTMIPEFREDTKLSMAVPDAIEVYKKKNLEPKDFNFVSECYFLTLRCLHIGVVRNCQKFRSRLKHHSEIQQTYESMKNSGASDMEIQRVERELVALWIRRWSDEVQLFDGELHKTLFEYFRFSCAFLLSHAHVKNDIELPEEVPELYATLPEYIVDDIFDSVIFFGRMKGEALNYTIHDEMLHLCVVLLHAPRFIKNPHVRSKIPELLLLFTPQDQIETSTTLESKRLFIDNPICKQHALNGLMKLYVDMEHTGTSMSFYEKFPVRFYVALIMKSLWQFQSFRDSFRELVQSNEHLKFFNMLLNDAIYLLDESLKFLKEIHNYESDMKNNRIPQNEMREREQQARANIPALQNYMLLAQETVIMMHYLSQDVPEPFLRPEMAPRVASMLNYLITHLAGDECQQLKVKNSSSYHFKPKQLITLIAQTFVNFGRFDSFLKAVAEDERSYKHTILAEKVPQILRKIGRPDKEVRDMEDVAKRAEQMSQQIKQEETELGDAPEEYLDALTYTVMEDPVMLPASKAVLDRATIERHLLNDETDPFNRSYLSVDMLIPQDELKKKIQDWKSKIKS